jgi:hypothetical protein
MGIESFYNSLGAIGGKTLVVTLAQSNGVGNTGGEAPPFQYHSPNLNAKIMGAQGDPSGGWLNESFTFVTFDYNAFPTTTFGNLHGAEPGIAKGFGTSPIWMLKVVEGSSSLAVEWQTGLKLREKAIEKINLALSLEKFDNIILYWNQHESDMVSNRWINYTPNFKNLLAEVETRIGRPFDKILVAKVNPEMVVNDPSLETGYDVVELAQQDLVTFYNGRYKLLSFDDLVPFHDNLHYTSDSQIIIGEDRLVPEIKAIMNS